MLIISTAENGALKVTLKWGDGGKGSGKGRSMVAADANEAALAVLHYFGSHDEGDASACPICRSNLERKGLS